MHTDIKIDSNCLVNLALSVVWTSARATHKDVRIFEKFNVWRDMDLLPEIIRKNLPGKTTGYNETFSFAPNSLVAASLQSNIHAISPQQFRRSLRRGLVIQPHNGRFYPKGLVGGVKDVYSEDMRPCRLIGQNEATMTFDFNHPLSSYELNIGVEVKGVAAHEGEHGGRCNDAILELLNGPGMQARYDNNVTDFLAGTPFKRVDEGNDSLFYSLPRMVDHMDKAALEQVESLYASLIPPQSRILDLMSSCNSHLPESVRPAQVVGLGMNRQELEANPLLSERIVHDLNMDTLLRFDDASFDVVICTASIEYLTQPFAIFAEVARVLKSGGLFINVFSNRWFPIKAVSIWSEMHEFERIGLVTEYYLQDMKFTDIHTYSLRGLARPENDAHIGQTLESDPVYAVWGRVS